MTTPTPFIVAKCQTSCLTSVFDDGPVSHIDENQNAMELYLHTVKLLVNLVIVDHHPDGYSVCNMFV